MCAVRFWNRLLHMNNKHLTQKVVKYQSIDISNYHWVGKLFNILDKVGTADKLTELKELNLIEIMKRMVKQCWFQT